MIELDAIELARQWQLSDAEALQLEREAQKPNGRRALDACNDIDRALSWLIGDRQEICVWLRTSQPPFYHRSPIKLILGSRHGRTVVRTALLNEAAEANDVNALAASLSP